ncbi:hypothetical protein Y032_0355g3345 [Ancylostoma ceylanicum]|uniref:Uncharacterized protein n=1 Tax=Ancylostoma ceylanicum TaxID=53326 RepID=A0A016RW91_9BILA|nr:hypothetical protein Y032_0355g3345 [Ancylostoma ceylanicum]
MRVLIVELAHFLLIVTAFNVRRDSDVHDASEISFELLDRLTSQLEKEMNENYKDVEPSSSDKKKITVKPIVAHQGGGDITVRLYPEGMKYAFEVGVTSIL